MQGRKDGKWERNTYAVNVSQRKDESSVKLIDVTNLWHVISNSDVALLYLQGKASAEEVWGMFAHAIDNAPVVITEQKLNRLDKFEKLGLEPEEIKKLKERDTPLEITDIHVDEYFCPACYAENLCDNGYVADNFCPVCGHRYRRKVQL